MEFSKLEGGPVDSRYEGVNTISEMVKLTDRLGIIDRLETFKVAAKALSQDKEKGAGYFMLLLDLEDKSIRYTRFGKSQLSEATEFYNEQEEKHRGDANKDVVLVSATSVRELKKAYPNYFSDTDDFQQYLLKVYKTYTGVD